MKWIVLLIGCLWLAGCPLKPLLTKEGIEPPPVETVSVGAPLEVWLTELDRGLALTPEQAREALGDAEQAKIPLQLFRQVLLNQQLAERGGWIWARDRLRLLQAQPLEPGLKGVLEMLLAHNQAMINAEQRESSLREQLVDVSQERDRLEEKIRALTNLERRLDIRKENGSSKKTTR